MTLTMVEKKIALGVVVIVAILILMGSAFQAPATPRERFIDVCISVHPEMSAHEAYKFCKE